MLHKEVAARTKAENQLVVERTQHAQALEAARRRVESELREAITAELRPILEGQIRQELEQEQKQKQNHEPVSTATVQLPGSPTRQPTAAVPSTGDAATDERLSALRERAQQLRKRAQETRDAAQETRDVAQTTNGAPQTQQPQPQMPAVKVEAEDAEATVDVLASLAAINRRMSITRGADRVAAAGAAAVTAAADPVTAAAEVV